MTMVGHCRRGHKRSRSCESEGSSHSSSSRSRRPRIDLYVELRILLQNKVAGAIIGKKGEYIKRLRQNYFANINLPSCNGPERILTITADMSAVLNVLSDIIPTISYELNGMSMDSELRILVQSKQVGALIGRGGGSIKHIREKTGCQIKVFTERCPDSTEQVVQLRGNRKEIVNCAKEILKTIENGRKSYERRRRYYDPNNYDSVTSSKYGGYTHSETLNSKHQNKHTSESSDPITCVTSSCSNSTHITGTLSTISTDSTPEKVTEVPSLLSIPVGGMTIDNPVASSNKSKSREAGDCVQLNDLDTSILTTTPLTSCVPSLLQLHVGGKPGGLVFENNSGRMKLKGPIETGIFSLSALPPASSIRRDCLKLDRVPASGLSGMLTQSQRDVVAPGMDCVFSDNCCSMTPVMTSKVGIPKELYHIIMGRRGRRLKFIEMKSCTKFWMDDEGDPYSTDYIINVTGSREQIFLALGLLQSAVKSHAHLIQRQQVFRQMTTQTWNRYDGYITEKS